MAELELNDNKNNNNNNDNNNNMVTNKFHKIGHLPMQWDNCAFASKGDVVAVTITVADWDESYNHKIRLSQYVPTAAEIYATLSTNLDTLTLVSFNTGNANVTTVWICFTIYMPLPLVTIIFVGDLTPVQACTSLRSAIISTGQEVECRAPIDWLCMALVCEAAIQRLILSAQDPTSPLVNANLLLHWHKLLIRDLPGLKLALARVQGTLIAANIGDLAIEHHEDRRYKELLHQASTVKIPS